MSGLFEDDEDPEITVEPSEPLPPDPVMEKVEKFFMLSNLRYNQLIVSVAQGNWIWAIEVTGLSKSMIGWISRSEENDLAAELKMDKQTLILHFLMKGSTVRGYKPEDGTQLPPPPPLIKRRQ